ncbi:hypothetical protein EVAR_56331_1 [Eumeta japonica]|uniref:Uncharacterized protein n=1 Tax=Eumeta variegata TaxID=151549 RepID=A0A4C1YFS3_EUMVA|nr:hypothetical protein EVAR_56331_1 [Eumeta japonica]
MILVVSSIFCYMATPPARLTHQILELSARDFTHVHIECVPPPLIWKDLAANPNPVPAFNSESGIVLGFDPGHALDPNPDPTLGFALGPFLTFGPRPSLNSAPCSASNSDTTHGSNLYKARIET